MLTRNDTTFQPDLSEQYGLCVGDGTVSGGWAANVIKSAVQTGIPSETELPFTSQNTSPLYPLASGWQNRVWMAVSYVNNNLNDTTANLKSELKLYGPMSVGVNADVSLYASVSAVENNYVAPSGNANHEIVLVGYQDDAKVPTGGYWIIKNSWNASWGNNGYGYIPYGSLEFYNDTSYLTKGVYYNGPMYHVGPSGSGGTDYTGTAATALWSGSGGATSEHVRVQHLEHRRHGVHLAQPGSPSQFRFDGKQSGNRHQRHRHCPRNELRQRRRPATLSPAAALTVTAGGIQAGESVTINSPITIGGQQSWTVASGKTLTVGAIHTVISDLTFNGAGSTTITGASMAAASSIPTAAQAPGSLIQGGSGALTFPGPYLATNITVNSGYGALYIAPASGATSTISGALSGNGSVVLNGAGTAALAGPRISAARSISNRCAEFRSR